MTDFKCAWESKNGPDAKRCQEQCESCLIFYGEPRPLPGLPGHLDEPDWIKSGVPREGDMR